MADESISQQDKDKDQKKEISKELLAEDFELSRELDDIPV